MNTQQIMQQELVEVGPHGAKREVYRSAGALPSQRTMAFFMKLFNEGYPLLVVEHNGNESLERVYSRWEAGALFENEDVSHLIDMLHV